MKKQKLLLQAVTASLLAYAGSTQAANITVGDPNTGSNGIFEDVGPGATYMPSSTGKAKWYKGGNTPESEYREVEPGMNVGGQWDLVGFSYDADNGNLSILSGFDLKNGYTPGGSDPHHYSLGHLFIKLNAAPNDYGDPNVNYPQFSPNSDFGFDLAVTFDFTNGKYRIYQLTSTTVLENAMFWNSNNANSASNPYKIADSALPGLSLLYTGSLTHDASVSDSEFTALAGFAPHRTAGTLTGSETIDVASYNSATLNNFPLGSFLSNASGSAVFHLTMSCGNDNLQGFRNGGWNRVPDGGATLTLLGLSLAGFSMIRRRIKA